MVFKFIAGGLLCALVGSAATSARAAVVQPTYHLAATWKLTGEGGWDYLTDDSAAHRLYIARGTRIQVINTDSGELAGEVTGVTGAHGVALDAVNHRGYATSGRDNSVVVFDTQTLKTVGAPIPVGTSPDAIVFEPTTKRVFAFDAGSNEATLIDTATGKVVQSVPLGSNPESGIADGAGHVWVNIEGSSELVELNAADGKIMQRVSLAPGDGPTGIAYDAQSGRVFSGCANKMMVVTDAKTGKQMAILPIGEGVDADAFDAKRGLAFASNGRDGTISVVGFDDTKLSVLNTIPSKKGARTMALDTQTGAIYVVAADYEPVDPNAAPANGRPRRPKMIPGSAVVLKFEADKTP